MNKVRLIFCFFIFVLAFVYLNDVKKINVVDLVTEKKEISVIKTLTDKNFKEPVSLLDIKQTDKIKNKKEEKEIKISKEVNTSKKDPIIYIYNTHQTEEYRNNIYNITPTVVTASNILQDELDELGISSFVETKDVIKEVKKRGLDYPGTYEVSLDYLMEREKQYPSLKYFFDIHRDSVTGQLARIEIEGKSYAKVMFLVGANYDTYEKRLNEVKKMEEYLNKNYNGIVRKTFINYESGYNQRYRDGMYLVEIGGPDNTLEEVYNSIHVLAKAIKYLMEE